MTEDVAKQMERLLNEQMTEEEFLKEFEKLTASQRKEEEPEASQEVKDEETTTEQAVTQPQTETPTEESQESATPETELPPSERRKRAEGLTAQERIEADPILRYLSGLSEQERLAWAETYGQQGFAKLLELSKLETLAEIEDLRMESQKPVLDLITQEWISAHKEWFQDPELVDVIKGLDLALLQKRGVASYVELSPAELKAHLAEVEKRVKKLVGKEEAAASSGGKKDDGVEKKEEGAAAPSRGVKSPFEGLGGQGLQGEESLLEKLSKVQNPVEFEQLVAKLSEEELARLYPDTYH